MIEWNAAVSCCAPLVSELHAPNILEHHVIDQGLASAKRSLIWAGRADAGPLLCPRHGRPKILLSSCVFPSPSSLAVCRDHVPCYISAACLSGHLLHSEPLRPV